MPFGAGIVRADYSPTLGRFLTRDPIGIAGGDVNWYCYCDNDPVNHTDPSGLCENDPRGVWDKAIDGYYVGTGYGESALDWYCSILDNPDSSFFEKAGAYIGGSFSALWTRESYWKTAAILAVASRLGNVAYLEVERRVTRTGIKKFKFQILNQGKTPIFRIEKAPIDGGSIPKWHYHRQGSPIFKPLGNGTTPSGKTNMGLHRPWEGGW